MGTDVHAIWQAKRNSRWEDIESQWDQHRHYLLFSWLANVRNGFGFAGVPTYDPVVPVALPRGLPEDFEMVDDCHPIKELAHMGDRAEYWSPGDPMEFWMGDHSHSWLTADEILAAKRPGTVQRTGIVDIQWFRAWDGKTPPSDWCGGISGRDVNLATSPAKVTPTTTHVSIEWDAPDGLEYFVEEVQRLKTLHGEVRVVFGFDS